MKIGEALKKERIRLGLTQDEMTKGIIQKSHYSKVERGIENISADSLFRILFAHHIDTENFLEEIKDNFQSDEGLRAEQLERQTMEAFNKSDTKQIREDIMKILNLKDDQILKYRSIISVATFEGKLNELSSEFKEQIVNTFTNYDNWVENVDSLRLFANCMQVFTLKKLDYFLAQLLRHYNQNYNYSEKMIERVAIICNNYLYYCFYSDVKGKNINNCLEYLNKLDNRNHFLFYRICQKFYYYLFRGEKGKAKQIKNQLISWGYKERVVGWKI